MTRVAIIDYGLANIQSVVNAVECFTRDVTIADKGDQLQDASHIILPGVGAFDEAMQGLHTRGHAEVLQKRVKEAGVPCLGICLGFQLIFAASEEGGKEKGLGWIDATIKAFPKGSEPVPHVGWNTVTKDADSRLLAGMDDREDFYFVHSFYAALDDCASWKPGASDYITPFAATVEKGNIFAAQFHPEKSQLSGLKLLENFLSVT